MTSKGTAWGVYSRYYYSRGSFPSDLGQLRSRLSAAAQQLLLDSHFSRQIVRRFHQPVRQLLFRRLRQQLRRPRRDQPLSRILQFSGRGHRCNRRAQLRQNAGRIQSAAQAIPRTGNHLDVRELGAADACFRPACSPISPAMRAAVTSLISARNWISAWCLFTYLNTTLSGGYAAAADRNGHISTQYMVSLRIL